MTHNSLNILKKCKKSRIRNCHRCIKRHLSVLLIPHSIAASFHLCKCVLITELKAATVQTFHMYTVYVAMFMVLEETKGDKQFVHYSHVLIMTPWLMRHHLAHARTHRCDNALIESNDNTPLVVMRLQFVSYKSKAKHDG